MEDLFLKIAQQVVAGGVGTILAAGGLFVLYKLGNKYLDKRNSRRQNGEATQAVPAFGGNGKGDDHARLIVLQEMTACNDRHKAGWREVEKSIVGAVREEIRKDYEETREAFITVHGRIDNIFEIMAKKLN